MLVQKKVQISAEEAAFIEEACRLLCYRSQSEYIREAISAKVRADRRELRRLKREKAMEDYGKAGAENLFASVEGEDFEDR